jgi:TonB family protein
MFSQFKSELSRRQKIFPSVSVALHLLLLAFVVHSPPPIFVAPALVTKGDGGRSLTRIYFGGESGITQNHPDLHVFLPQREQTKPIALHHLAAIPAKKQKGNDVRASVAADALSAGSVYGSLSYGRIIGPEVRPALPVVSVDPAVSSDLLDGMTGDVVIEITIDSAGNITDMKVLQSFMPAVDQKVLAAVEQWHFLPATRDGSPIPSKQDVHYHFPR